MQPDPFVASRNATTTGHAFAIGAALVLAAALLWLAGGRAAPSRASAVGTDEQAVLLQVEALHAQASARRVQGDSQGAARALAASTTLLDGLRTRAPFQPEVLRQLGNNAYWLGQLSKDRGDLGGAAVHWQAYLELAGQLSRLQPANAAWWIERSYALNNLGSLATARGEWARAAHAFTRSIALKRRALAARPDDAGLLVDLADSYSWLGMAREALGQLAAAEQWYGHEMALVARLRAQAPHDTLRRHREVRALWRRGALLMVRGDDAAALADLRAAARGFVAILGVEPENRIWRVEQASVALRIEDILGRMPEDHDAAGASARLAAIHARLSRLQQLDAGQRGWAQIEAAARIRLGAALLREGRVDAARRHARAAAVRLDALVAGAAGNVGLRVATAGALLLLADIDAALGEPGGARRACRRAHALLKDAGSGGRDHRVLDPWVRTTLCLGEQDAARLAAARLHAIGYLDGDYRHFLSTRLKGQP